jgi:hypothetical protein
MSDFTLYKVSQDFENLVDLMDRDVLEEWEVKELEQKLSTAIASQSKDIVKYYINEMADIESLKNEIKRLQTIKSSKEAGIERLKDRLSENMRTLKCPKIATPLGNITLALDSTTEKVEVDENVDYDKIPEQYLKVSKEVKKSDIKKAIQSGETFEGVNIVSSPARVAFRLGQESKDYIAEAGE